MSDYRLPCLSTAWTSLHHGDDDGCATVVFQMMCWRKQKHENGDAFGPNVFNMIWARDRAPASPPEAPHRAELSAARRRCLGVGPVADREVFEALRKSSSTNLVRGLYLDQASSVRRHFERSTSLANASQCEAGSCANPKMRERVEREGRMRTLRSAEMSKYWSRQSV